jgi:Rps23 Pro-64 3,4-dihydroxylase Tpa1-like proline 4-hydroxylase
MRRKELAAIIVSRLSRERSRLTAEFHDPSRIPSTFIDNLLPEEEVMKAYQQFPDGDKMYYRNTIRERKYTTQDMAKYPALEEVLYAFQEPEVLREISAITGIKTLLADPHLYAGGISRMEYDNFLQPHLDNSHDKDMTNYRVLNLLYYITPGWKQENGGNFELWDQGMTGQPREIVSAFNRLLIMATHDTSWHSVNRVKANPLPRLCVSNYYFSPEPLNHPYFHVTSFAGRPEQKIRSVILRADRALRMGLRKVLKHGIHVHKMVRKDI